MVKAINVINSDLVNNLGNLIQRATSKRLNPSQEYPVFDKNVIEYDLKESGEFLIADLNSLLGI